MGGTARGSAEPVVPFDADRPAVEAARRDPRAFEPLYRKYVAQVYSFAVYETRDRSVAEDVTEQVFLRALAALPRFRERGEGADSTFRAWLFTIARNTLANVRRTERRHPVAPLDAANLVAGGRDPADVAAERAELDRAWEAIASLPDDRRQAIVLRLVNELSAREIGDIMGRSEGAVRVLIHRGLSTVRARMRG
jgi:RNA polymerase sigma-70 factor (ECF subfamily)